MQKMMGYSFARNILHITLLSFIIEIHLICGDRSYRQDVILGGFGHYLFMHLLAENKVWCGYIRNMFHFIPMPLAFRSTNDKQL